jgi:cation:H+ antiporter
MDVVLEFLKALVSIVVIAKSADWLVESAARIASRLGVSQLIIGLTVIAFGTSAPEFAVSVSAALRGFGNIAVANIVGSNIFNICFILGFSAILRPIITTKKLVYRDCVFMAFGTLLVLTFIYNLAIGIEEGAVLFSLLIIYLLFLAWRREAPEEVEVKVGEAKWYDAILLFVGLLGVIAGGNLLVSSAVKIATAAGISQWAIGVTLVAFGTSVPELATSATAALKKYYAISAGNLIGSNIFNIFGVIGLAGILNRMTFDIEARQDLFIMLSSVILVTILMRTGWKVSRKEGLLLILVSILWWYDIIVLR